MKKMPVGRRSKRRKVSSGRRGRSAPKTQWIGRWLALGFGFLLFITMYHYRNGLSYYLGFTSLKEKKESRSKRFSDVRNFQLLEKYDDRVVGIDVSQYQGKIVWERVQYVENTFPIRFVFIRATAGSDKSDLRFQDNWIGAKKRGLLRGAYHYYRPNENSVAQALFFIKNVTLERGDLPPILDIESLPKNQSIDSLKMGLRRWLLKVDAHYGIKPIIYTSEKYYEDFLKDDFADYSFWIANYNFFTEKMKDGWLFWQFTEKASIEGIEGNVDVNIYNGTEKMLRYETMR